MFIAQRVHLLQLANDRKLKLHLNTGTSHPTSLIGSRRYDVSQKNDLSQIDLSLG